MMNLLAWWNLIFELPFLGALIYTLLLATGAVSAEHEADTDVDTDVDAELDADGELHHDVPDVVDHHMDGNGAAGLFKVLSVLGVGKAPLSIVLTSLLFIWGFIGWASNFILSGIIASPGVFVWLSVLLAGVSSILLTRFIANGLGRVMPKAETYGVAQRELLGRTAEARYDITPTFGAALVRDKHGNLHEVACVVRPDQASIAAGSAVVLAEYDAEKGVFMVLTEAGFQELLSS